MTRLRFFGAVALVAACAFLGSFVSSRYWRAPTATAASTRVPVAVLALRVADLRKRVKALEKELHVTPPPWCGIGILYDYVSALRATVVDGAEPPPAKPDLCL
jgi:hypothetical protein